MTYQPQNNNNSLYGVPLAALQDAQRYWRENAPDAFKSLLDAGNPDSKFKFQPSNLSYLNIDTNEQLDRKKQTGLLLPLLALIAGSMGNTASQAVSDSSIDFKAEMGKQVNLANTLAFAVGSGGLNQLDDASLNGLGQILNQEQTYLEGFKQDVQHGQVTEAQAGARAEMYTNTASKSFDEAQRIIAAKAGFKLERRVLDPSAKDCQDCIKFANAGWQPVGTLPEIGDSQCRGNCKCHFEFKKDGNEPVNMSEDELILFDETDLNADFDETAEVITLKGKIFESGDFPDKNFSITPDELKQAVEAFQPVDIDLSHTNTVLDGKLGKLTYVELDADGKTLLGTVELPKWLDNAIGPAARKVSCTWNRTTKTLQKLALTPNPRIPDAVLVAAFSEFSSNKETPEMPENQNNAEFEAAKAENEALKAKLEAQEAALAQFKADKRHTEAEKLADELIAAKKAFPAEKAAIVAMFEQASKDDEANPAEVHFAEGDNGKGNRVDGLKAMFAARPEHKLDVEMLKNDPEAMEKLSVLFTKQTTEKKDGAISPERRAKLLGHSSLGLTVLKEGK